VCESRGRGYKYYLRVTREYLCIVVQVKVKRPRDIRKRLDLAVLLSELPKNQLDFCLDLIRSDTLFKTFGTISRKKEE
jgi:hypothetical protein